jgi:NADH-quinone oxidoreductase subunit C
MTIEEILDAVKGEFKERILSDEVKFDQLNINVPKDDNTEVILFLKEHEDLKFDHLADLCGVDYFKSRDVRYEVVYNLYSIKFKHRIRVKIQVPEDDMEVNSLTCIFNGADWHECECFDMFGIKFRGHPHLKRVFMPENWVGYPLRKDYPLKGIGVWEDHEKLLKKVESLSKFEIRRGG